MKHTDPYFGRTLLAYVLLASGGLMIGDGVVKRVYEVSNTSIPVGSSVIILGIIVLVGTERRTPQNISKDSEPEAEQSPEETEKGNAHNEQQGSRPDVI